MNFINHVIEAIWAVVFFFSKGRCVKRLSILEDVRVRSVCEKENPFIVL